MNVTHKKRDRKKESPYKAFGELLERQRLAKGIASQAEFSLRVKASQQTVSRWEAGSTRPREQQVSLIATVLDLKPEELLDLAGYGAKATVASYDKPFPVDGLGPESFERFCRYLLQLLYPKAKVHAAGGPGHKQDGTDILVSLDNGDVLSFQCKRVNDFGRKNVLTAVAAHTIKAKDKVIVLSRVASPQARAALAGKKGWSLWDKEDLSHKVRQLSKEEQRTLVDIFFKGQRQALLGDSETGSWETTEEFFRAYENAAGLFNHKWHLVGRSQKLAETEAALESVDKQAVFLVGGGGSGKTRLLKHAIEQYERRSNRTIRFLSPTSEITKSSLEELGSKPITIVIDDAHDRSDLSLIFRYVATNSDAKIVLSFRPYGLDHIRSQASGFSLVADNIAEIVLDPLTLAESTELATQVLKAHSAPVRLAEGIARLTRDCPLATVIGAQIVAKEKIYYDLAANEDSFRATLLGKFKDVIAGEIGRKSDTGSIKKILGLLSLIQPFDPSDKALLEGIRKVEGLEHHESSRLIKLLIDGGILFQRGARYRLSPDVLADYVVESLCVGPGGRSTGYAERVFDALEERHVDNLLLNLGKLDWRRSNGDASNSWLLDGVWSKLKAEREYSDPHIRAIARVAYYQPARALDFAEDLIRRGKFVDQLTDLIKYAAYNLQFVERACENLWQIGKTNSKELHSNPNHPVRVLAELCEVAPGKPYEFNEKIVDFGLRLADDATAWAYKYTPLDILIPILKTEGHTTSSTANAVSFKPFFVSRKFVAPLRKRVVEKILSLLSCPDLRVANRAALALGEALRFPHGLLGAHASDKTRESWVAEFVETIGALDEVKDAVQPIVMIAVLRSLSHHANYGDGPVTNAAKRFIESLPNSFEFRVLKVLVDGYGTELRRIDPADHSAKWAAHVNEIRDEIISRYPDGESLRTFIAHNLEQVAAVRDTHSSPFVLISSLAQRSEGLAKAIVTDAFANSDSVTARYSQIALASLRQSDPSYAREMLGRLANSGNEQLRQYAAGAFASSNFATAPLVPDETTILTDLLAGDSDEIVQSGLAALRFLAQSEPAAALQLALGANIGSSHRRADELCSLFTWEQLVPFSLLTKEDAKEVLRKLMAVPQLEGHWIETFLSTASAHFPDLIAKFLMDRVDRATELESWDYRPCNHGPYAHVQMKFQETKAYGPLLGEVVKWMKSKDLIGNKKALFDYRSRELFEAIFGSFDSEVLDFIERWSAAADANEFRLIGNILEEAPEDFVFKHPNFVITLLDRATKIDPETSEFVSSRLFGSSVSGVRSGTPGEPFERDVQAKAKSETILAGLSRFTPAYEFYEAIKKQAEHEIERSKRERAAFEDE